MSINEIKNYTFKLQRGGSYKAAEVDGFLEEVRITIDALVSAYENAKKDNEELYRKMSVLADKIEEYKANEDSIRATLLTAQKFADTVANEAKEKAEILVNDAEKQAADAIASIKKETDDYVITKKNDADLYAAKLTSEADGYHAKKMREADELYEKAKSEYEQKMDQAELKAKAILEKAQSEATKVISDCEEKKAEMIAKANTQADEIVSNTQARIDFSQTKLSELKSATAQFKASVTDILKKEIEMLDMISVSESDYSAEYYPATFSINSDAIYRPELTVDENNTDENDVDEEEIQIIEEPEEVIDEDVNFGVESEETVEPAVETSSSNEEIESVEDIEISEEIIPDDEEDQDDAEDDTQSETDFYAQLMEKFAKERENGPEAIEEMQDDDDEGEEVPVKVDSDTGSKGVFTKIDFFEGTDDDDKDVSSGRTDLSSLDGDEDDLRFGTDYDIFGEDDDTQTSFFSKFRKK